MYSINDTGSIFRVINTLTNSFALHFSILLAQLIMFNIKRNAFIYSEDFNYLVKGITTCTQLTKLILNLR